MDRGNRFFGGPMPMMKNINDKNKVPLPKNVKDVPRYVKEVVSSFFSHLFYIFKLVWETNPWIMIGMGILALVQGLLPIAGTYITAMIINALALSMTGEAVTAAAIGILFMYQFVYSFISRITGDVNNMVTGLAGELVTNHIRRKIMAKAKEIDIGCYDMPDFYESLENANREAGMRPIQILNSSLNIVSTVISLAGFIIVLLGISTWAPFLVAVLSLPSAVISYIFRRKTAGYMRFRSKSRRQMNYYSQVMVNKDLAKEVRLLDLGGDFERRYDEVFTDYYSGLKRIIVAESIWNVCFGLLRICASCGLFFFVAMLVLKKEIQIGDYSFYTGALSSISSSVTTLITGTATVYEGTLFIDNLIAFMKQKPKVVPIGEPLQPNVGASHRIEFKNVSFSYPGCDKQVIKNLSLCFEPGETVALVGLNGAGKTTIVKLLTRLYDPTEGVILLDGVDIRRYDLKALYRLYGIVFQDFGKYAVTAAENIRFGQLDREYNNDEIIDAARQSNVLGYFERLPKKLDTPLSRFFEEDGIELSGGTWQKLAVARAFYGDTDILILDEPTAALDALAEQEIFRQFDSLRSGKTTLFVSHRLSSAVDADKIIVIKEGELIEQGTHTELLNKNGTYALMFKTQAEKYQL